MRTTHLNGLAALTLLAVGPLFAACQAQPIEAIGNTPGALGACKPRDELPPPTINAPNGGACPALGSDCQNMVPISLCEDSGGRRMILACENASKTWKVAVEECPADGGTTPTVVAFVNTPPSATCKPRSEIPPPLSPLLAHGVGPDGVTCVPAGQACDFPMDLCTDKDGRRIYMECDNTKHTWYIVYKECP
jgi:hypothetical protein